MASIDTFLGSSLTNLNSLSSKINSEDENMKTVVEYLYTLTEQLRYIFNHIDEENMTDGVVQNIVKEETQSQYAHFTETETSITAVIQGLNAAQQAVKVIFDAAGLTIKNGGFQILNNNNQAVFSVTPSGDIFVKGEYETVAKYDSGSTWRALIDGGKFSAYCENTFKGGFIPLTGQRLLSVSQEMSLSNQYNISTGISTGALVRAYISTDNTPVPRFYMRNTAEELVADMSVTSVGGYLDLNRANGNSAISIGGYANGGFIDMFAANGTTKVVQIQATSEAKGLVYTDTVAAYDFNNRSSKRYKTDINDMSLEDANKLLNQQFVKFRYKDRDTYNYGLIAEDTDLKEIVTKDEQGRPDAIDYTKLIPYMGRLIQEQEKRIRRLEDERHS